jgi:hypothetical protein
VQYWKKTHPVTLVMVQFKHPLMAEGAVDDGKRWST